MTGVNLMSARSYGEFEFWFASIKVAAIIVFIVLAAPMRLAGLRLPGHTFANLTAHQGFMPFGFVAVLSGATVVFFSLTGAEIVTIAAAESAEPARAIAKMTTSVVDPHSHVLRAFDTADRLRHSVGRRAPRRIAVHAGAEPHGLRLGGHRDERHHPDGGVCPA